MASYSAVDVSDVALNTNTNVRSMQFYSTGKKTKLLTEQHLYLFHGFIIELAYKNVSAQFYLQNNFMYFYFLVMYSRIG